ncbi:hypothetical protein BDDG_12537 [Blastomyces dermatitidis ATCC 18188]|uniref:Lipid droplet-associated hydrolase n=1 Tax=Ajellomyces dermatitidis (strain ATCC 18188 / CBS 674.68) TaxID=653446 RepID=A0A0J9EPU6_AJEDA|nr:hypothetical protein BDDG_12537 [Blastomyces dermatitidis ATCC 18188]
MTLTTPHITANSFLTTTTTTSTSSTTTDDPEPVLIYFITGNPGLISYYHAYLSLLSSELSPGTDVDGCGAPDSGSWSNSNSNRNIPQCIIHGKSMGGFEIIENDRGVSNVNGGTEAQAHPRAAAATNTKLYNLSEQIEHVERNLNDFVDAWRARMEWRQETDGNGVAQEEEEGGGGGVERRQRGGANVILIGHSVGAYVAMELIRRQRERNSKRQTKTSSSAGKGECGNGNDGAMDIIGGILLFPTVVDIAKSSSGRKLTRLLYIPYLALLTSLLVKLLVFILPGSWLRSVVGMVMGSPPGNAIDTTVEFLRSRRGVEQAIHMAADEMREITSDTWSDEIWGIVSSSPARSSTPISTTASVPAKVPLNLVLYFAQQDHWVADQTRDDIIRARGGMEKGTGSNGPRMQVCEDGVVHGFCIRHSDIMAKKTAAWVRDIIQGRQNGQRFTTTA